MRSASNDSNLDITHTPIVDIYRDGVDGDNVVIDAEGGPANNAKKAASPRVPSQKFMSQSKSFNKFKNKDKAISKLKATSSEPRFSRNISRQMTSYQGFKKDKEGLALHKNGS